MFEVWREIGDWREYEVSSLGRVRRGHHILKAVPVRSGKSKNYKPLRVSLSRPGLVCSFKIAELVLIAFRGPRPVGKIVRHLDDIQEHNELTNLRWGTNKQNGGDRIKNGRSCSGSTNGNSKLTLTKVRQIKRLYIKQSSEFGVVALAHRFGVSGSTISNIVTEKVWAHVR